MCFLFFINHIQGVANALLVFTHTLLFANNAIIPNQTLDLNNEALLLLPFLLKAAATSMMTPLTHSWMSCCKVLTSCR